MKRYAIVRVDHSYCPIIEESGKGCYCPQDKDRNFYCADCKTFKNYGDTKEQLIKKVAQVINRFIIPQRLINSFDREMLMKNYQLNKKLAKEIVEFLGVVE